jgi:hypothetical protein
VVVGVGLRSLAQPHLRYRFSVLDDYL